MRRSEKRKSEKKEGVGARKGRKVSGQMRDNKLHAVAARSTFPSQNAKGPHVSTIFESCDIKKWHAVVARSTFPSQEC